MPGQLLDNLFENADHQTKPLPA
ncbi:uncharacterized protein METZ01_LOCUS121654 [marine metagenome]|uniref:Uncharacterized protein n=1 Tax=marine metagenome TaxID=408172 RepID=A0A381XVY9_9ZZZZ